MPRQLLILPSFPFPFSPWALEVQPRGEHLHMMNNTSGQVGRVRRVWTWQQQGSGSREKSFRIRRAVILQGGQLRMQSPRPPQWESGRSMEDLPPQQPAVLRRSPWHVWAMWQQGYLYITLPCHRGTSALSRAMCGGSWGSQHSYMGHGEKVIEAAKLCYMACFRCRALWIISYFLDSYLRVRLFETNTRSLTTVAAVFFKWFLSGYWSSTIFPSCATQHAEQSMSKVCTFNVLTDTCFMAGYLDSHWPTSSPSQPSPVSTHDGSNIPLSSSMQSLALLQASPLGPSNLQSYLLKDQAHERVLLSLPICRKDVRRVLGDWDRQWTAAGAEGTKDSA